MLSTALLVANALLAHPLTWILYFDAAIVAAASSLQTPSVAALNQILVSRGPAAFRVGAVEREQHNGVDHRTRARRPRGGRVRTGLGILRQRRDLHVLARACSTN